MDTKDLYNFLYSQALSGSCMHRKYAAAIVKNGMLLGHGFATTIDGQKCITCPRQSKMKEHGEVAEFFEVCNVIHAEVCAILDCKNIESIRESSLFLLGISVPDNQIYENAYPCSNCLKLIKYTGVARIHVFQKNQSTLCFEV